VRAHRSPSSLLRSYVKRYIGVKIEVGFPKFEFSELYNAEMLEFRRFREFSAFRLTRRNHHSKIEAFNTLRQRHSALNSGAAWKCFDGQRKGIHKQYYLLLR